MHKGITEDHVTKGALGPLLWSSSSVGCCPHCWPSRSRRPRALAGPARLACIREAAGRHQQAKSQRELIQAALLPTLLHSSWLSFPLSPLAPSEPNLQALKCHWPQGQQCLCPWQPLQLRRDSLQTFPNSFGCCHLALPRTPPLPSEASPLVFAFISCSICRSNCTHVLKSNV